MVQIAAALDVAMKAAGIPITGVSVGRPEDRASWRVDFARTATAQQISDGLSIVATFDPASQIAQDGMTDNQVESLIDQPIVGALLLFFLRVMLGKDPDPTALAQGRAELAAALKDVLRQTP